LFFGREPTNETLVINDKSFKFGSTMKVLGVEFDYRLKFNHHIANVVAKSKKLSSALRMIRKKLKFDQFLKVMTCQYYGKCFYGCLVWLNGFVDLRKLNAIHYSSRRIAKKDYKNQISKASLDTMGRARPSIWAQCLMASGAIKAITRDSPPILSVECKRNMFVREEWKIDQNFLMTPVRRLASKQFVIASAMVVYEDDWRIILVSTLVYNSKFLHILTLFLNLIFWHWYFVIVHNSCKA